MTFAELRQAVTQQTVLNTDLFAEIVRWKAPSLAETTMTVKIEPHTKPNNQQMQGGVRPSGRGDVDAFERIRVVVSHDAAFSGGFISATPAIGTLLYRDEEIDSDTRAWTYTGECLARGTYSGTYVFERAKRTSETRRVV